jgi:hypothetical protein
LGIQYETFSEMDDRVEKTRVPTKRKADHCPITDTPNEMRHSVKDFDFHHRCGVLGKGHQGMIPRTTTVRGKDFLRGQLSFLKNIRYEFPDCLRKLGSNDGCLIWVTLLEFIHDIIKLDALVVLYS